MIYSKLKFYSELINVVDSQDEYEIARWADNTYLDNKEFLGEGELNLINDLRFICIPGFEISKKEMLNICNKLLSEYIDSIEE